MRSVSISRRRALLAGLAATLAAGLPLATPALAQDAAPHPLPVVATFSILGDIVKNVGGDRISVVTLVGPNGDTHVYQPTPQAAKEVAEAAVVFENGLGLEGWMDRLVKASGTKAELVAVTQGVTPRYRTASEPQDDDEEEGHDAAGQSAAGHDHAEAAPAEAHKGHDHGPLDPHAWQNVANVEIYAANIRDALIKADPAGAEAYKAQAAAYIEKLKVLDAQVRTAMAGIPVKQRRIITSHDAFGYFGDAYGLKLLAPQGVSTEAEASAKDVGRIIRQIKSQKIPAVFLENIADPRLAQRIAKESGARVGGELYSDALSDDKGPASTYIDMIQSNVRELSSALSS
ncbi:metal ABC transporter solute-binding protein, Zn/Mn family [Ancylobacter amanitiformis]|uniref:Zinc/manganese transport system substrate-binding protein n=1 Tax=Ancylobacter amanitiformis TaxID=217069 RepID=A0ABU0LP31_9HYPH|nr:zinc ABC transporter substrate-binding protein [Ancylobacter amanitiformis]MDQ0510423.1 zinc/manganese transport system substrate-binding protein [Ancylobacter amanitiformis]